MRNEMIGAVVRRAIEHPEFRKRLIENPNEALRAHGFALEASDIEELARIRRGMDGFDDARATSHLESIARQYGVDPRPT